MVEENRISNLFQAIWDQITDLWLIDDNSQWRLLSSLHDNGFTLNDQRKDRKYRLMTMLNWKNVLLQITFLSLLLKTFFFPFPQKCTLTDFFINNDDSSDKFYIKFPGLFLLCFFIVFSFFCCVGCF